MIGTIYALSAALIWATSSTILKSLVSKIDALSLNTLRLSVASIVLLAIIFLFGRGTELVNTPLVPLVYLIISGVIGLGIGDTTFVKSLSYLNVSRVFPIALSSNAVFTVLLSVLLLGESFTWVTGLGTFFVLVSVYLLTYTRTTNAKARSTSGKGVISALMAGALWSIAVVTFKLGAIEIGSLVATTVKLSAATLALLPFALSQGEKGTLQIRKYSRRSLAIAVASGPLDYGLGMILFISAIQLIGAGKAVVISASSPLFLLPFSVFLLKERLTRFTLMGILISVTGIYLVAL